MNNSGQIVGGFGTVYIYQNGVFTALPFLPGSNSQSVGGINDAGEVTGTAYYPASNSLRAFLYSGGSITDLGTLPGGEAGRSDGKWINNHGQVVGQSDPGYNGFLYSGGAMTMLPAVTSVSDINDSGQIVGRLYPSNTAVVINGGVATPLGPLNGAPCDNASGINNLGQIVGTCYPSAGGGRGFLYSSGVMIDIGELGGNFTQPWAINNLGQIVGLSALPGGPQHAFLRRDGTMFDLNELLAPGSPAITLVLARYINDSGMIVADGADGAFYLLTPVPDPNAEVPEPSVFAPLGLGLAWILRARRARLLLQ